MSDSDAPLPHVPESRALSKKRTRLSLVWFIPIVAAIAGAWVAVVRILGEGPKVEIVFKSAEGLEAGKTKIQYNGVDVGVVTTVRLSDDHSQVITTAQMAPKTEGFLVDDTRFWVVRPRISGANVTGLNTLISGAYVAIDIGQSTKSMRTFVALETPPVVTGEVRGRFFIAKTPDLGSLDSGTPVFFRRLQVGQVASYQLDKDGQALSLKLFINAPYDQYITPNTRFWHASGFDVSLSAAGLTVQTQSALSILIGGVAFETPPTDGLAPPAEENTVFTLFNNRADAFKLPAHDPQTFVLTFKESVRGLAPGAPVEFHGIAIGEVAEINAQIDAKTFEFSAPVTIHLDAQRLGVAVRDLAPGEDIGSIRKKLIDTLVSNGARAQLRTGNLLTGSLFVAFEVFPGTPAVTVDWSRTPPELPTVPGELAAIQASVVNIIKKLDQVPIKSIGEDLEKTIADLDRALVSGRGTLDNANKLIEPNSVLGAELGNTLQEVSRAARSVRVLADYLERHPESLIRGKAEEKK
ncbi:MAG: MCE family protein [Deltaproteobacteria bacterium]|nr:MCE family protein [Deltaproteobacteria bacterium]MBI3390176.1 MCE family protein [Deltaproteobacteria bacterium]